MAELSKVHAVLDEFGPENVEVAERYEMEIDPTVDGVWLEFKTALPPELARLVVHTVAGWHATREVSGG